MLFYEIFTWYKKKHGRRLEFVSDTEVRSPERVGSTMRTCLFENEISDSICDRFSITFKIKVIGRSSSNFYIGYAFGGDIIEHSVRNWDVQLGQIDNKHISESWCLWNDEVRYSFGDDQFVARGNRYKFKENDLIRLAFDFQKKSVTIYYDGKAQHGTDLQATKFWVGVSLHFGGDQVEMVEYKYQ